jgi:hypothetical protein
VKEFGGLTTCRMSRHGSRRWVGVVSLAAKLLHLPDKPAGVERIGAWREGGSCLQLTLVLNRVSDRLGKTEGDVGLTPHRHSRVDPLTFPAGAAVMT